MNDKEQKLIMMIGLSGSGKSYFAKELIQAYPNGIIISTDDIREELSLGDRRPQDLEKCFNVYRKRIREALTEGKTVIADATQLRAKNRTMVLDIAKKFPCKIEAVVITKPIEDCILDDAARDRHVGATYIRDQLTRFELPFEEEGFDVIDYISGVPEWKREKPNESFLDTTWCAMECMYQNNMHHRHYVGEHCRDTAELFERFNYGRAYNLAARFHDVGKLFTVSRGADGREHYYRHENVGAYYLLCHAEDIKSATGFSDKEVLDMVFLVNYHMLPRKWTESDKTKRRWERRLGMEKTQLIKDFNSCDKSRELEIKRTLAEMTEREKETHVHGVEFTIDYGYLPEEEDYQLYLAILEERKEKEGSER